MRYFVLVCVSFLLVACGSEDAQYYRLHPQLLQTALKNCPQTSPRQISCDELVKIADEVNQLAYQLQRDPQDFGNIILSAQAKLAKLEADAVNDTTQSDLRAQIVQGKQKIAEYMAIVRWLESPEK